MQWLPFKRKTIPAAGQPLAEQIGMLIKSLSLPQSAPNWRLYAHHQKDWDAERAITHGYNASSIVYASIEKRARSIASVPAMAMRKLPDGTYEHAPDSPLQKLINRPNPDMDWCDLMHHISQSLDIAGNAFISEIKAGVRNEPSAMWPLPAQYMRIKPGRESLVDYYEYTEVGRVRIENADMIQIKMPNPDSAYFGMPPLKAAAMATDVDRESATWQKVSLQNRGASDINIKLPDNATQEQVDMIKAQYKAQQEGPANARKALISNADIQSLGQTAVELDFVNSRKTVWSEIAAVFGVPLAVLGFTETVNLANAGEMRRIFWQDTICPQVDMIYRQLTHQLAYDFGTEWAIWPDYTNIEALQEDFVKKLESARKLFDMGVPFNEINTKLELGLDQIDGGDVGYLSAGLIPAGAIAFDEPDEEMKKLFKAAAYGKTTDS